MRPFLKKAVSLLLTAVLLSSLALVSGYADGEADDAKYIEPAESFAGGTGTEDDPYQISSAAELALLGDVYETLAQTHDFSDERVAPYFQAYYVLTDDIVINDRADDEDWSQTPPEYAWMPIGFHRAFEGVFDGAGHTVSGLYINADGSEKSGAYGDQFGLFGENGGTIKNVALDKSYICIVGSASGVGGIAGSNRLADTSVENCTVSADIYCGDVECGGIVGLNRGTVQGCAFSGSVTCPEEDALSCDLGGIVGYNSGKVGSCANSGVIVCSSLDGSVGGIVGSHTGGEIRDCENTGAVTGGESAGGIAGLGFLSSIGGDLKAEQADILDCQNSGAVSTAGEYAGGIAGQYMLDYSDFAITVSGCENTGSIEAAEKLGGVIGLATIQGEGGMSVTSCNNSASLDGHIVGGIIGSASEMFGTLTVADCKNSGEIKADMYAAGIAAENNLMTWDEDKAYPLNVTLSGCENTGAITASKGGGIAGVFVNTIAANNGGRVTVTLENDVNSADIRCTDDNAFVGGIAGNVGVPGGAVTVKDCRASGVISYPAVQIDAETTGITKDEFRLEMSRIGGGIVGMVGGGLYLSTANDGKDASHVNSPDASIVFTGCHSDMTFSSPDESEYVYDDDGTPVLLNRFGGILGFCSDGEGLAFRVEDCTFTGCERGLGNADLPDVGTKS